MDLKAVNFQEWPQNFYCVMQQLDSDAIFATHGLSKRQNRKQSDGSRTFGVKTTGDNCHCAALYLVVNLIKASQKVIGSDQMLGKLVVDIKLFQ